MKTQYLEVAPSEVQVGDVFIDGSELRTVKGTMASHWPGDPSLKTMLLIFDPGAFIEGLHVPLTLAPVKVLRSVR